MIEVSLLFLAIGFTVFSVNYKFSKAVRLIAYHEEETQAGAYADIFLMIGITVLWTIYFSLF
jgi:hypothetical protein